MVYRVIVKEITPGNFKNTNMQNALFDKRNPVIGGIQTGNRSDALAQLEDDILGKTNGCACFSLRIESHKGCKGDKEGREWLAYML